MPKAKGAKTKSAPKPIYWALAIIILAIVVGALCLNRFSKSSSSATLQADGHTYFVAVAKTPKAQKKGLAGRTSMPANQGMLFVFDNESVRCFWMKDMKFPLDMIWLNTEKQVVALRSNVSPDTFPETFCPPHPAEFVIELNAGQAELSHIQPGQKLKF